MQFTSLKGALALLALFAFTPANAALIEHTNDPATSSEIYDYIYFSHDNAWDSALGTITNVKVDFRVYDIDQPTNLQVSLSGNWTNVGSFTGTNDWWTWRNFYLNSAAINELASTGSLDFRFNEAQSDLWGAEYDKSILSITYTPAPVVTQPPSQVPEPSVLGLMGLGLATLGFGVARRRSV